MNVAEALKQVYEHVDKHSHNKYQNTDMNTEDALVLPVFTLMTAKKYLARYLAKQGEKTSNPEDLKKAIHFILFELQSSINNKKVTTKQELNASLEKQDYKFENPKVCSLCKEAGITWCVTRNCPTMASLK